MFPIPKIRRKAFNMNNPVCNAGLKSHPYVTQLRSELNCYAVPEGMGIISYPELRCAYSGLFNFKTYGLVFTNKNLIQPLKGV